MVRLMALERSSVNVTFIAGGDTDLRASTFVSFAGEQHGSVAMCGITGGYSPVTIVGDAFFLRWLAATALEAADLTDKADALALARVEAAQERDAAALVEAAARLTSAEGRST